MQRSNSPQLNRSAGVPATIPENGDGSYEDVQPVVTVPAPSTSRTRPRAAAPMPLQPRTLNVRQITYNDITWVDIIHPTEVETEWLRQRYNFHPLHLDDMLSKIQRPKIDDTDKYTFLVMHIPIYSKLVRVTTPSEVDIFVGPNFVVTAHAGNLKPILRLFKECAEDATVRGTAMGRSTGYLLYNIVDKLVDYCFPILNKIDINIEQVEDQIFEDKVRRTIQEISVIRRDIIAFRRIVKPLIPVVSSLERKRRPFLKEDVEEYFGDIADHLSKIWDTLEDYKEVIEGLSDTLTSLTNNRINEIIRGLTIISVILLPLTLISGLFGQNVPLPLELSDNPYAFGIILGLMLLITIVMLIFFRWRRWI